MKASKLQTTLQLLLTVTAMGAAASACASENQKERDPREFNYLQLAGGAALSSSADIDVGLGSIVKLPGSARYDRGSLWGVTLGRQFLREEDEQEKQKRAQASKAAGEKPQEPQPMRVELEFWNAAVKRNTITLAAETVHPNDKIKPRVLFVNLAVPIAESDEQYPPEDPKRKPEPLWRTWLGAGIGYASLSYPSASAISGCNCLREASGNGLAYQLKLQAERQIGENTYLFGQIGRVWLPSVSVAQGTIRTEYGRWGVNNLAIGVRWVFRD